MPGRRSQVGPPRMAEAIPPGPRTTASTYGSRASSGRSTAAKALASTTSWTSASAARSSVMAVRSRNSISSLLRTSAGAAIRTATAAPVFLAARTCSAVVFASRPSSRTSSPTPSRDPGASGAVSRTAASSPITRQETHGTPPACASSPEGPTCATVPEGPTFVSST